LVLVGSAVGLYAAESETFTAAAAASGTYKRPQLLVDGKRYELKASQKADASVAEALAGLQASCIWSLTRGPCCRPYGEFGSGGLNLRGFVVGPARLRRNGGHNLSGFLPSRPCMAVKGLDQWCHAFTQLR